MKKAEFYTLCRTDGKVAAKKQNGYSDDKFYYYKNMGVWFAIHPDNGLSIFTAKTRRDVAALAHKPENLEKLERALNNDGGRSIKRFRAALEVSA